VTSPCLVTAPAEIPSPSENQAALIQEYVNMQYIIPPLRPGSPPVNKGETKVASLIPPSINQEFENLASTHTSIKPANGIAKSSNLQANTLMYHPLI